MKFVKQPETWEIFKKIYKENQWGGSPGELYSGPGSHEHYIIQPYIKMVLNYLKAYGHDKPIVVDLGCGDFNIGRRFIDFSSEYVGVDVVPDVIRKLRLSGYPSHVRFLCLDIIKKELPDGDICFIRQVLQHLSNKQIYLILPKLRRYRVIFITEHYPIDGPKIVPNTDMGPGCDNRVEMNSGVFLDAPPFNIPSKAMQLMLEVLDIKYGGVIRTYKIEW